MKIWNTKYALTQGILEQDVEQVNETMVLFAPKPGTLLYLHGEGREWHRSKESAIAYCETMRKRKIDSLRKQIKKLEAMTFDV